MLSIRNQIICLSIAMLLMICFQPDQVNGQIKKKKLLKGLMGASLLKLLKPKKGGVLPLPFPLPLPLPIDWHTQAGLLSKNNPPTHVSHQPYAQSANFQMSPIEYSEYQNAISQALSNSNSYIPSYPSSGSSSYPSSGSSSYPSSGSSSAYSSAGQNENSDGYNSNSGSVSNSYSDAGSSSGSNNYGSSSGSNNNYDSSSGSNNNYDASSNYGSNTGPASYGVAGVGQNDEYNAYQVSNDNGQSGGYRAAASSINPEYNSFQRNPDISEMMMNAQNNKNQGYYGRNYDAIQQGSSMTARLRDQLMAFADKERNKINLQDNNGAASSNSFSTSSQQNNYIPLRSVPMYHHHVTDNQQSNYQPLSNVPQKSFTSNGFSSSSSNGWQPLD